MAWIDRPRHGWEGIYETDEKFVGPSMDKKKELSAEEQMRLDGEETERIAAAIEAEGFGAEALEPTISKKFRPMSKEPIETMESTPEVIVDNEQAIEEVEKNAMMDIEFISQHFRRR